MYFTRDNGFTWDVKYLFPDYTLPDDNLRSFFALDPARFWYGQANFMTFTSDTLHTFTLVEPPTIAEELTNVGSIHFKDSMNGWCTQVWSAGGHEHEGFVLHTSDGGETWMRVPYLFGREFAWFGTDLSLCYSTSFPNEPIHMTENAWSGWIDFPPPSLYMLSYSIKSQSSFWGIGYNGRIYERKR
jgi:hypothetical protein